MQMDKETQIKSLKENVEALEGKIKFLQDTCRRAGSKRSNSMEARRSRKV
jgi:chaperonin cofactor prefoldin